MSSAMPSPKYSCSGSPLMFWNGRTAIDGLSGRPSAAWRSRALAALLEPQPKGADRPRDVLQRLLAHIFEGEADSCRQASSCTRAETQIPPGSADAFQPRGDVDAVAENVAVLLDDVADIDADAEIYAARRSACAGVALGHAGLDLDGAAHCIDDAGELGEQPVAGGLHDPAAVPRDRWDRRVRGDARRAGERAFLVSAHQPAVAGDVGRKDRRELPFDPIHGQPLSPFGKSDYTPVPCLTPVRASHHGGPTFRRGD